jgi:tetratricopeptide (TPR) repeat protein
MNQDLAQLAILAALNCDWNTAVKINKDILKKDPKNSDALNRAAKAYFELGDIQKAKKYAQKALKLDPLDPIAQKCFDKYQSVNPDFLNISGGANSEKTKQTPEVFIEEPGKTKTVQLINLGDREIILNLDSGDCAQFLIGKHRVSICTDFGKYIGRLPDDIASRIIKLLKKGNQYEVYIKSAEPKCIRVFIKEIKKAKSQINYPSFPLEKRDTSEQNYLT